MSSVGAFIAFLWAVFVIDQQNDKNLFEEHFSENIEILKNENNFHNRVNDNKDIHKDIHPLRLLIDLNNIKDMFGTCCKRRTNYVRLQIWLLFASTSIYLLAHVGPIIFLFAFVQKVYSWDSETYSNASTIDKLIVALGTITIGPILIKVCFY